MKTDRSFTRPFAGAVALAALLAVSASAISFPTVQITVKGKGARRAEQLTQEVELVQRSFDRGRRALPTVPGPDGVPEHPRAAVAALIDETEADLDQAIVRVDPELAALDAWAKEEIRKVRADLAAAPPATPPGLAATWGAPTARPFAVLARLRPLPWRDTIAFAATKPKPKPPAPAPPPAPQPDTLPAARSGELLDRVENVIGKIFFLASHDDLEVKLWVGSTPDQAAFRYWPQGEIKGSTPAAATLRTNGKRTKALRGLYAYKAAWAKGAVTEYLEYPPRRDAPPAPMPSDRLDLVNGSDNFCCRFGEKYCSHVDDEKECKPAKR